MLPEHLLGMQWWKGTFVRTNQFRLLFKNSAAFWAEVIFKLPSRLEPFSSSRGSKGNSYIE
jgi:hypothetical protein